jgi:putative transposase
MSCILNGMSGPKRRLRTKHKSDITFAGGIYHVTQRAPGKEVLFIDEDDHLYMIALLKSASKQYKLDIFSFCCMPNHIHILTRTNENNLIIAMKTVFEQYAKRFNRKYERKGHVFCGTFAAALCEFDDYFLTISLYIHLNPCSAGLCHDPAHYRWSSVRAYTEMIKETFINRAYLFELIDANPDKARVIYRQMLEATRDLKIKKFIFKNEDSSAFKQKIVETMRRSENLKSIIERIFPHVVTNDDLRRLTLPKGRRLRNPDQLKKRSYIIQQLKSEGYSISDIAEKLNISRKAVYDSLK